MKIPGFEHIILAQPWFLLLWLLIPVMLWWQYRRNAAHGSRFTVSSVQGMQQARPSAKVRMSALLPVLRVIGLAALVLALARPQSTFTNETINSEGIDIMLSLDVSGSMLAEDFSPNRMEAAKKISKEFIDERPTDRIGLVIFSGESFTQCPITTDHSVLKQQLMSIKSGMLQDGTAIGMGLATGVDRLRHSNGKSRVLILLTDGVNNTGLVDPVTALEIAKAFKIRVYTIGVGTTGMALMPVPTPNGMQKQQVPVQIDEPLLNKIAKETGGKYFRATGNAQLKNIYAEIDKLEKTSIEINSYKRYTELFFPFAAVAMLLLVLEMLLRYTWLRKLG